MRPYAMIIDDFFRDFDTVRSYFDKAEFKADFVNPRDSLVYPKIIDMENDQFGIEHNLGLIFGCRIGMQAIIARLSLKDCKPPYAVHSDAFMGGNYTAIIYLTPTRHIERAAGTVLCKSIRYGIETWESLPQELTGANEYDAWEPLVHCPMRENRAFIFPSNQLHYSNPFNGGFGTDQTNGRLVLAVVFSLAGLTT